MKENRALSREADLFGDSLTAVKESHVSKHFVNCCFKYCFQMLKTAGLHVENNQSWKTLYYHTTFPTPTPLIFRVKDLDQSQWKLNPCVSPKSYTTVLKGTYAPWVNKMLYPGELMLMKTPSRSLSAALLVLPKEVLTVVIFHGLNLTTQIASAFSFSVTCRKILEAT